MFKLFCQQFQATQLLNRTLPCCYHNDDQIVHDDCAFVQDLCVPDGHALQDDGLVGTHDSPVDVSFSFSCTDLDDDFASETRLLSGTG